MYIIEDYFEKLEEAGAYKGMLKKFVPRRKITTVGKKVRKIGEKLGIVKKKTLVQKIKEKIKKPPMKTSSWTTKDKQNRAKARALRD